MFVFQVRVEKEKLITFNIDNINTARKSYKGPKPPKVRLDEKVANDVLGWLHSHKIPEEKIPAQLKKNLSVELYVINENEFGLNHGGLGTLQSFIVTLYGESVWKDVKANISEGITAGKVLFNKNIERNKEREKDYKEFEKKQKKQNAPKLDKFDVIITQVEPNEFYVPVEKKKTGKT